MAEALFDLALLGVHLSRIGEEVVLWSSEEFGFVRLDDAYATGSSMLPQKKNPDIAELARGKAGRLIGNLTGLLVTLKGLPLAYNRDLQEDKEPLFDAVDQVRLGALGPRAGCSPTATFDIDRMAGGGRHAARPRPPTWPSSSSPRGTPFRDAHAVVGGLVRALARAARCRWPTLVAADARPGRGGRRPARAGRPRHPPHDARRRRPRRGRRPSTLPVPPRPGPARLRR